LGALFKFSTVMFSINTFKYSFDFHAFQDKCIPKT